MLRLLFATLALLIWSTVPALADSSASNTHPLDQGRQLAQDEQIAVDLEGLDIDRLLHNSEKPLVILKVSPGPTNGNSVRKSTYADVTDPKTGVVSNVLQSVTDEGFKVSGQYLAFDVYTQKPIKDHGDYSYQWTTPSIIDQGSFDYHKSRVISVSDHGNRFMLGGTVLCRLDAAVPGAGRFFDDTLIFPAWKRYVPDALNFCKLHPGVFVPANAKKNRIALLLLLDGTNPFLSASAAHCLAGHQQMAGHELNDLSFVQSYLAEPNVYKQAAFTLLLIYDSPDDINPLLVSKFTDVISSAPDADHIKGIALAAYILNNKRLLTQINEKLLALNTHTEADSYIVNMLTLARVRK